MLHFVDLVLPMQVALFTATMPESLQELAAAWLQQPEVIRVATSAACISSSITQVVQVCAEHKKVSTGKCMDVWGWNQLVSALHDVRHGVLCAVSQTDQAS